MERCEVLIIGGGPAGSTLAWKLARAGLSALVLDRSEFPRDKTCAGWITPAVVEELELDLVAYARGRTLQPFHGFSVGTIGGPEVTTDYGRPVSYGIRRCELDHHLLDRAVRAGARTRLATPARTFERRGERWVVNGEIEADLVVGAAGHFCPVARFLGTERPESEPAVVAQEVEFRANGDHAAREVPPELPLLAFCPDLKGYGWVERKGDWLNVGLGRQDPRALSAHVADFAAGLAAREVIPASTPGKLAGHAYRLYEAPLHRRTIADGMLLVGDAAGLAYRQSGEGIRTAVESALLAARTIAGAAPDFRRARLEPYRAALVDRFGEPERIAWGRASALLPAALARRIAARVLATRAFARRVVLDRWFLHASVAPLRA